MLLQKHGLPALPVNSPRDFMEDPHIVDRGFFGTVEHPVLGSFAQPGVPFLLDGERRGPRPAPMLGQHNAEVLGALGLSDQDLGVLSAEGVI